MYYFIGLRVLAHTLHGGGILADLSILPQNVNKNTARAFALAPDHPVAAQYAGGLVDSL